MRFLAHARQQLPSSQACREASWSLMTPSFYYKMRLGYPYRTSTLLLHCVRSN